MFSALSEKLVRTVKQLRGQGRLTEQNIKDALRDVRIALLAADVALPVVREFIEAVRVRAIGEEVTASLSPGQAVIKIVHSELVALMGDAHTPLNLHTSPPAVILLAGLQGAGKTTSAVKLACWIRQQLKKSVLLASCDVYRPAAIEQLQILSAQHGLSVHASDVSMAPTEIASAALAEARAKLVDILIMDTAGRLHVDAEMMQEIQSLQQQLNPSEILFVADSMLGQDAVNVIQSFNDALPLTGAILTKADGDARGGAALTIRKITGKPIKFLGTGEKIDALVPFHPERMASRILGMGDVLSLIEEVDRNTDKQQAAKLSKQLSRGQFTLLDFQQQLGQMRNMGGLAGVLDKLPMQGIAGQLPQNFDDKTLIRSEAMICAMTPAERANPKLLNASRRRRIARGSGVMVQDVNQLMKQFSQMQRMLKQMRKKNGMARILLGLGGNFT